MESGVHPEMWTTEPPSSWPEAPHYISVTTLTEIETCPRQWALKRADYPTLWGRRGYPQRVHAGALRGSVVHMALEEVIGELRRANCPSVTDISAIEVMRRLGGYTNILNDCIDRVIDGLRVNPRAQRNLESLERFARAQVPHLRTQVQSMLSRVLLQEGGSSGAKSSPSGFRGPIPTGTYSELEVRSRRIGWKGKVDLLVISPERCEITDFKTGAVSEAHQFQLEVYAVLWTLDKERNPQGRSANRLILAYNTAEVEVSVPGLDRSRALEQQLNEGRAAARAAVSQNPPEAKPDPSHCSSCQVRQLCKEYWTSDVQKQRYDEDRDMCFGDFEATITARHGPASWDARLEHPDDGLRGDKAVVRTALGAELKIGERYRFLNGAMLVDAENPEHPAVVTLGTASEVFRVSQSGR